MALAFLLIIPVAFLIGVVIGAVFLRASISLANKVFSPEVSGYRPPPRQLPSDNISSAMPDPSNPYAAPSTPMAPAYGGTFRPAIPEPSFGKAMGIVAVAGIVGGVINIVIGLVLQGSPELALVGGFANLLVGFLVSSTVYSMMLPTSFGRAALVYLFTILIVIAIAVVVGGMFLGIGLLTG